jgi:hypothetical protein
MISPPPRFVLISNSSTVYTELIYISSLFIFFLFYPNAHEVPISFLTLDPHHQTPPPQSYGTPWI